MLLRWGAGTWLVSKPLRSAPEKFVLHSRLIRGTVVPLAIMTKVLPDGVMDGGREVEVESVTECAAAVLAVACGGHSLLLRVACLVNRCCRLRSSTRRLLVLVLPRHGLQDQRSVLPVEDRLGNMDSCGLETLGSTWISAVL